VPLLPHQPEGNHEEDHQCTNSNYIGWFDWY
jgi:hypothetical protein